MAEDIHWYAETGQLEKLRNALLSGVPVDSRDDEGRTALHRAALLGRKDAIDALIAAGADLEAEEAWAPGHRALHRACLAEGGAHAGADLVRFLLARGADPAAPNSRGETALHLCVAWCGADLVELLIEKGGGVKAKDHEGSTPLHVACRQPSASARGMLSGNLLEEPARFPASRSALREDSARGRLEHAHVVETLIAEGAELDARDSHGVTPLQLAVASGAFWNAKLLIEHGADVNVADEFGTTALYRAQESGSAELLVEHGAAVNAADRDGNTPLHQAISSGRAEVADLLLARGASVSAENREGRTPLHVAAAVGRAQMVEKLILRRADVNARDTYGQTPLSAAEAAGHSHVVATLKRHGAKRRRRWFFFL
jgi:ankyrin repeat protein